MLPGPEFWEPLPEAASIKASKFVRPTQYHGILRIQNTF
jgi:hypothetical protein